MHYDILTPIRFANCSARFINAYKRGLDGPQAAWANKKYHGHRVLLDSIMQALDTTALEIS